MRDIRTTVTVPAEPASLSVLRAMAGDAAGNADLTFDQLSNLELAVDEGAALMLSTLPAQVRVSLHASNGAVTVETLAVGPTTNQKRNELALVVLEAVTDTLEISADDAAAPSVRAVIGAP